MGTASRMGIEAADIATPPGSGGFFATLFSGPTVPALAARPGAWLATLWGAPTRFGSKVIMARHAHLSELLARDLQFPIGPVNSPPIQPLNGPFVPSMCLS